MANYCSYDMRIVGKKENVNEMIAMLKYDHPDERHFYRVFSAGIYNAEERPDGRYAVDASGDCAWSVYSAMIEEEGYEKLCNVSGELELDIEVWSSEYGVGFQEHYIYSNGVEVESHCKDATEYIMESLHEEYGTLEKANAATNANFTKEEWNDVYCDVIRGGFDNYGTFSI